MCTVSWQFDTAGYQLFFNRDELNSRQPALPPEIKQHQNTRIIAPTDTDAGGTWISVNEHGLTLCLLNNYAAPAQIVDQDWISRGQLVSDHSHFREPDGLINQLQSTHLYHYRPFDLLALSLNDHIWQLSWNGSQLQQIKNPKPFTAVLRTSCAKCYTTATLSRQPPAGTRRSLSVHAQRQWPNREL